MLTTLVLAVMLCCAHALPSHIITRSEREQYFKESAAAKNNAIEQFLLSKLEELRETMLHGSDDVPVLDPLHEEFVSVDLAELVAEFIDIPLTGNLEMTNMILNHLATFVVNDLRFNLLTQVLRFDISIPVLELLAENYDLKLNVEGITVNGNGAATVRAINVRVTGSARAAISLIGGASINVRDVNIVLHLDGLESNIENLMGTGPESDFINAIISDVVPVLVDVYQLEITEVLNAVVLEAINDLLN